MDDELRMKLADLGSPEKLANCIIDHLGEIQPPILPEPIAQSVGIVEIQGKETDGFEGILLTTADKSRGSIAYNSSSRVERRRFTIAHELGHFLMPTHGLRAQCAKGDMSAFSDKTPERSKEAEANLFAASLLMPRKMFGHSIRRLGAPETEHVLSLASAYQVSKEAAARRYTDICDYKCAVIFSRAGKIRSFCKTSNFPYLDIVVGRALPPASISAKMRIEAGRMSEWFEIPQDVWTSGQKLKGKLLYEQYFQQADGYSLTMLTIDDSEDDGEDEDEDELRDRWTLRHRK